jgi:hypothetical protein
MTIYTLISMAKEAVHWVSVVITVSIIIAAFWLSERVLYKTCLDLLDLWKRYKQVKRTRSWVIEDGGDNEQSTN